MLVIRDEALIKRLEDIAALEGHSVETVITEMVEQKEAEIEDKYVINSQLLAQIAREMAFEGKNPIDAEQADDILNAEFADYLLKRMEDGDSASTDR